ncbi:hypothetical protein L9F63_022903 [Diploptera punctata]|uniref:Uncharacterized protein n=1 Tax=Diploptera punctata TaxID=6984 RepID=A0AAD7ZMW6_DIPPU|nr:hypothetical protein L9F63_022903 [Diploptera punctata]
MEAIQGNVNISDIANFPVSSETDEAHEYREDYLAPHRDPQTDSNNLNNIMENNNIFLSNFSPPHTRKKKFDFNNDDLLAATILSAIHREEMESLFQALGDTEEEFQYENRHLSQPDKRKWKLQSSNKSHYFNIDDKDNEGPITIKRYFGSSKSVISAIRWYE